MKREIYIRLTASVVLILLMVACSQKTEREDMEFSNTPAGNFLSLWTIMDERYCFFDLKKEQLGVDWDEVQERYAASISNEMSSKSLFEVLCSMIGELRDGHVNLTSPYDYGRNWSWKTDYPSNYSADLREKYLGKDYVIAGDGYFYRILDDNIGYLVVESFGSFISSNRINVMFGNMLLCNGLIIDIRDNGGGDLRAAEFLASHFTEKSLPVSYSCYKTGPGHNDFSTPIAEYLEPYDGLRWNKPVVILTNRGCFSATNDFVKCVKGAPNVTIIGDRTGGGSGMPFHSEIPNGWSVRYSAVVYYDKDMKHTEFGIEPDIPLQMSGAETSHGKDTYIEYARRYLITQSME